MQFLIVAMTLGLLGGLLGIVFGVAAACIMTVVAGWPTIIAPGSIVVASVFSLLVGLFFGLYPANKAGGSTPLTP